MSPSLWFDHVDTLPYPAPPGGRIDPGQVTESRIGRITPHTMSTGPAGSGKDRNSLIETLNGVEITALAAASSHM